MLPGDRKFTDYAFPPELGYPSFARENNNRPIDRQPLNPPSDMGGYPQRLPAVLSVFGPVMRIVPCFGAAIGRVLNQVKDVCRKIATLFRIML